MNLILEISQCYCYPNPFTINEIEADLEDFGHGRDMDRENAAPYSCGNRQFTVKLPTQEILTKYNITVDEYKEIAEKLEEGLSFGRCGWCS